MTATTPERRPYDPDYDIPEAPAQPDWMSGVPEGERTRAQPAPTTAAPEYDDESGAAFIKQLFVDVFGGALLEFAEQAWQDYNDDKPLEQILYELRQTPEYAARFPAMSELRKKGRPISESAYLDLERTYVQVARQFDLPPGFYDDPKDLGTFIENEQSPAEFQRRLTAWQSYERETRDPVAEAEIRAQFAAAGHTPSDGDFLAAALDPTRAVKAIERRLQAGLVSTEAARAGYGSLSVDEGLRLADLGVSTEAAREGFGTLADNRELFTDLPGGEAEETFGRGEQLGAAFGTDAAAQRRIARQARRRQAEFAGGGGGGLGRGGIAGLGTAG